MRRRRRRRRRRENNKIVEEGIITLRRDRCVFDSFCFKRRRLDLARPC